MKMHSWQFMAITFAMLAASASANELGLSADPPVDGRSVKTDQGYMVAYEETIPGTNVTFKMIPIPGGEFLLGSPADEADRGEGEGPQVRVRVEPRWVGACEVTWSEYHVFMNLYEPLKKIDEIRYYASTAEEGSPLATTLNKAPTLKSYLDKPVEIDAVTCPTPLYDSSFTYEVGEEPNQPAVTMTQFAAKQYTKWLSGIIERDYRLPTEAEWEHAARAGSASAFSFGDDDEQLDEYAWYEDNADDQTQPVASKKPNPWGLYDVHGNVAEWVLDEYDAKHFAKIDPGAAAFDAARWPAKVYPRVTRGGCWYDAPDRLRSAARGWSDDEEWALSDPNLPLSPWWFTEYESQGVGFRLVRPLIPLDEETKQRVWEPDVDPLRFDVEDRLAEGRGVQGPVTSSLPKAIAELEEAEDDIDNAIHN